MDTPLVMQESNESYFDMEYKMQAIWLGVIWFAMLWPPGIMWWSAWGYRSWNTAGEWAAWHLLWATNSLEFVTLLVFFFLSWVKTSNHRNLQKYYYRAIAWIVPISWFFAFWVFIAFLVGGLQASGQIGYDMMFTFLHWAFTIGFEMLAFYLAPRVIKFYKWRSQSWWNYNKEDAPNNWPSQLADDFDNFLVDF